MDWIDNSHVHMLNIAKTLLHMHLEFGRVDGVNMQYIFNAACHSFAFPLPSMRLESSYFSGQPKAQSLPILKSWWFNGLFLGPQPGSCLLQGPQGVSAEHRPDAKHPLRN